MIIIRERETYDKPTWLLKLDIDESDFTFLIENGILKLEISENGDKKYRNRFVGFIAISNNILYSQPKFMPSSGLLNFNYLIAIFSQYKNRKFKNKTIRRFDYYGLTESNYKDTLFEYNLYISLLDYYQQYGIYSVEMKIYNSNSNNINWNRTVNINTPIHSSGTLIYPNPISTNVSTQDNTISLIQISILIYLDEKYKIGNSTLNKRDLEKYQHIPISDLISNSSTWFSIIQNELSKTYQHNYLSLLNYLSSFFNGNTFIYKNNKKSLYGTISFHNLWEDACSQVFNSQYDSLKHKIAQPKWKFYSPVLIKDTIGQIPDILHENENNIFILDAKYYYPLPRSLCGWADIVKQYFYAKSFKNPDNKTIINALLFPDLSIENLELSGTIAMEREGHVEPSFTPISVYKLNPFILFDSYIENIETPELLNSFTTQ